MLWPPRDLLASIRFTVIPPNVLASLRLIVGEVNDQWCCPSKDEGRSTFAPCDWMNLFAVVADSPEYRCMRSRACSLRNPFEGSTYAAVGVSRWFMMYRDRSSRIILLSFFLFYFFYFQDLFCFSIWEYASQKSWNRFWNSFLFSLKIKNINTFSQRVRALYDVDILWRTNEYILFHFWATGGSRMGRLSRSPSLVY